MSSITLQEIQSDLDAFLRRVEAGESLLVLRGQEPVAEIKPIAHQPNGPRPFGLAAGQFTIPAEFDSPLPEDILRDF